MIIDAIRNMVSAGQIKWTVHSLEKMGERDISIADVKNCIAHGEVIEEYPHDFPFPSCLIYGKAEDGRIIHVVAGYNSDTIFIITAYIPNTDKFADDFKTRRK